jgi:hypothetical protein
MATDASSLPPSTASTSAGAGSSAASERNSRGSPAASLSMGTTMATPVIVLGALQPPGRARELGADQVDYDATLAYHGARAEKPGFTFTLERNFNPAVGTLETYPQEFTRAMLNLFPNGFYAATRKARDAAGPDFQPTLAVATEARSDAVVIRVRDNGTGIPDNAKARLFEPFSTTKPAGEGTGVGLSVSHDIIVKQHSGSIAVDSQLGEYTEFAITLPRANAKRHQEPSHPRGRKGRTPYLLAW